MIADPVYFCGTGKDCVKLCQAIFILKDIKMFLTVNKPIFFLTNLSLKSVC